MLGGCADKEILQWDLAAEEWKCAPILDYTITAGVPPSSCSDVGSWYEDSNTGFQYVCDGGQWKLLESSAACFLGGAYIQ